VSYYLAFPLKRRTDIGHLVNVLDVNLHVATHVFGNGDVAARAIVRAIELPPGWSFLDPFRKPQPSAANDLPDVDPLAVVVAGQAVPASKGSLLISPPSGTLVPDQAFDLALSCRPPARASRP
jgi:hypothetical protein